MGHQEDQHEHGHRHGDSHAGPASLPRLISVIFFNVLITIAEYIGGVLSGSLALLSDAGHNFSDVLSLMLGYAGEKVSQKDPSARYSFGLKRFEVLIALINALSLLAIGLFIVYEAVHRFLNPQPIDIRIMLVVAAIGLAGNVFSMAVLLRDRNRNINLRAAFLHLFYDALSSVAVILAGIMLYFTGQTWLDLAASLVIVVMMAGSSINIIREALQIFLQRTPASIDAEEVYNSLHGMEEVGSVHGLHIWSISSQEIFLSCHICLSENTKSAESDPVIRKINAMLAEKYSITHTTLQIERDRVCSLEGADCCR